MANNIIFVGDSYCASTDQQRYDFSGQQRNQNYIKDCPGHPAIVADHYQAELFCHGYRGKSWWYSRYRFQQDLKQNPTMLDTTHAMVFFHTAASRVNSNNHDLNVLHLPHNYEQALKLHPDWRSSRGVELSNACRLWIQHLCDDEFQDWAQQQYFIELARQYNRIKTIHFHCTGYSVGSSDLLPGMVYTTSLDEISDKEPGAPGWVNDLRANHMNPHNNRALAQVIIDSIDNYSPGLHTINLTGFDII
jgi:hypothetical protein